ncbi:hypothetical protein VN97_g12838 [Penicillium thymicola]|uniref:Uncharacterized protein n=1 Tax=Penicillium thymicola TaxID=293382 RepID=A0AAI9T4U6_PENTH|nr:hypothetical protein VN97_g12838 [Penicillium thymicola]
MSKLLPHWGPSNRGFTLIIKNYSINLCKVTRQLFLLLRVTQGTHLGLGPNPTHGLGFRGRVGVLGGFWRGLPAVCLVLEIT